MTGRLTTHILNTAQGRPAGGVLIEIWRINAGGDSQSQAQRSLLRTVRTNEGGRTDEPLLVGDALQVGTYELVFMIGDYFADIGLANAEVRFLDHVPIRIGIADAGLHYHVPLLASPWAYSTYRGS